MIRKCLLFFSVTMSVLLSSSLFCHAGTVEVKTDKAAYRYGETIKVTYSGAPGLDSDWICVVSASLPDTDAGDYKYMPKGPNSGALAFDPPAPGTYEVRAYYKLFGF